MGHKSKIAIICNYELLPERVGGMDYFFWMFDKKCKDNGIETEWFFPNEGFHGNYASMNIIPSQYLKTELFFSENYNKPSGYYSHIFTHFVEPCLPVFLKIRRITGARIIVADHNPRPIQGYSLRKKITKRLKGILFSASIDKFIGVSNIVQQQLIEEFGFRIKPKIHVIYNGVASEKFEKKTTYTGSNRFMVASHLRQDKGIQDLIEAVASLKQSLPMDLTIDLYGDGPYESILKDMIDNLGVESFFTFKGSQPDLFKIYAQYDYLIHPSHGETFCYAVVESLMSGLPVITTNRHGNVLGLVLPYKNGFLYDAEDIQGLATILSGIITNKYKIGPINHNSPKLDSLTLERMAENYIQLITQPLC